MPDFVAPTIEEMRQNVAARLVFTDSTQQGDILNKEQDHLIQLLDILTCPSDKLAHNGKLGLGYIIGVTALESDHHDDSYLSSQPGHAGTHAVGDAIDCWPMNSRTQGDWMDQNSTKFQAFLKDIRLQAHYLQTGLAGSAWTPANVAAAGDAEFHDDGGDHVHVGVD